MTAMVANLTQGKRFRELAPQMEVVARQAEGAINDFERFMREDQTVFTKYMSAYKLPKDTPEEAKARQEALLNAAAAAAEVPLCLAEQCVHMLSIAAKIANSGNKHAISDLGVAAAMLQAAVTSALLTVDINLASLPIDDIKNGLSDRRIRVEQETASLFADILKTVRARL